MKIYLAQTNVTVGALRPNAEKMVRLAREARAADAELIAFPELALCGYPPEDLILKPHFLEDVESMLRGMASELPGDLVAVVGAPLRDGGFVFNAAHVFHEGRIVAVARKMLLPNYGVFDEKRLFSEGTKPLALDIGGVRIGLHVCEDSWRPHEAPCAAFAGAGLSGLLNISASPYHYGKSRLRETMLGAAAEVVQAPVLYCNLVGGQDELVFDGTSMAVEAGGRVAARAASFLDDLLAVDLPERKAVHSAPGDFERLSLARRPDAAPKTARSFSGERMESPPEGMAEVYSALKLGLRDYLDKNGFEHCVVALSGGIDSALVATVAVDALGAGRVTGVTMPSRFSSAETRGDAALLAKNLNIDFLTIPIENVFGACLNELSPAFHARPPDLTEENLQARIRGVFIMALSNKFGWLVISTGNKSELATGYCTLYGDMCGGFALIKDVPKTLVFELARWRNAQGSHPVIPPSTLERPPSAELREHQRDSDHLPPYDLLDPILERYVERDWSFPRIVQDGFDAAMVRKVIRLVDLSEYKRRQGAPGVKITPRAFGRDRRAPITNLYRERL